MINLVLLTLCAPPATSTYVRLLYSTVDPATWPSNPVEWRAFVTREYLPGGKVTISRIKSYQSMA